MRGQFLYIFEVCESNWHFPYIEDTQLSQPGLEHLTACFEPRYLVTSFNNPICPPTPLRLIKTVSPSFPDILTWISGVRKTRRIQHFDVDQAKGFKNVNKCDKIISIWNFWFHHYYYCLLIILSSCHKRGLSSFTADWTATFDLSLGVQNWWHAWNL